MAVGLEGGLAQRGSLRAQPQLARERGQVGQERVEPVGVAGLERAGGQRRTLGDGRIATRVGAPWPATR